MNITAITIGLIIVATCISFIWLANSARMGSSFNILFTALLVIGFWGYATLITLSILGGDLVRVIVGIINIPFVLLFFSWIQGSIKLRTHLVRNGWVVNLAQSFNLCAMSCSWGLKVSRSPNLLPSREDSKGLDWFEAENSDYRRLLRCFREQMRSHK
ncbi:MAG: hypothetical protein JJU11_09080 [Candidatus Sumerlaeia bacterium]|nr:hypothetical protein [Candidatus Sumerlaeia bacterium]